MDQESLVGKGVGEKRVDGGGRTWRHRLGKFKVNGSKSKRPRPALRVLSNKLDGVKEKKKRVFCRSLT